MSDYFHWKILWNFSQFSSLTFADGLTQMLEFNELAFKDKKCGVLLYHGDCNIYLQAIICYIIACVDIGYKY